MRKIAAIFFLAVILLSQTPLQQVLKLPVLIEHFKEHKAENHTISFAAFITLHYFSGNPVDDDYQRDMQLPFRTTDVVMISSTAEVPEQIEVGPAAPLYQTRSYPSFALTQLPPNHGFDIWQPPNIDKQFS